MRPRSDPPAELLALAAEQAGVLSSEQASGFGLGRHAVARLLDQGHWTRIAHGVVWAKRLLPGDELPWLARAWAGILAGGDGSRLGPVASGYLHGLIDQAPDRPDVLVSSFKASAQATGPWLLHRERPQVRSARAVGIPPRLVVAATAIDLCDQAEADDVVGLLTRTVQRRAATSRQLLDKLDARRRHRHRRLVSEILGDVADGAESPLELAYVRDVERPHGLPRGQRQKSRFGLSHISDVGYDEYALLVELDGRDGHVEEGQFRDRRRDNAFALRSMLTLRFGWYDVTGSPCAVAWQVSAVLRARGWTGAFVRCSRCRTVTDVDFEVMA